MEKMTYRFFIYTINSLITMPRVIKRPLVILFDVFVIFISTWLAFFVKFDATIENYRPVYMAFLMSIIIYVPLFMINGLHNALYRYNGLAIYLRIFRFGLVYGLLYFLLIAFVGGRSIPKMIGVVQPIFLFYFIMVTRFGIHYLLQSRSSVHCINPNRRKALVYGAGAAGRQLVSGLYQNSEIQPCAYIDDNSKYWNKIINNLTVYPPSDLPFLLSKKGITDVLLAMPSASKSRQNKILSDLSKYPVRVRVLPGLEHLVNGTVKVDDIRDVEIEHLLCRDEVKLEPDLIAHDITGKVILVTGAGGSIGSELSRQIASMNPKALVLFEISEVSLYSIELELINAFKSLRIIPILGSVLDSQKLQRLIRQHRVETIYHAAAYKHVPMIEMNPVEGVWNNVFGTLRTVEAACQGGVQTFVLISTDKAVRPTSVMGCSKRIAELILQAKSIQENQLNVTSTKFTMVRFGNVLGSSGSVVPLFRKQIIGGGPLTVTHPEIIRYFMTIPEAAQLVIQAGAMGTGGDVMVLDMGSPVKILDLAKRMIHLSGLSLKDKDNPYGDIGIEFTGLRPGEKLYEELLIGDNTQSTSHARIMRATEHALSWMELEPILFELEAAIRADNCESIRTLLKKAVPEFNPQ